MLCVSRSFCLREWWIEPYKPWIATDYNVLNHQRTSVSFPWVSLAAAFRQTWNPKKESLLREEEIVTHFAYLCSQKAGTDLGKEQSRGCHLHFWYLDSGLPFLVHATHSDRNSHSSSLYKGCVTLSRTHFPVKTSQISNGTRSVFLFLSSLICCGGLMCSCRLCVLNSCNWLTLSCFSLYR